jgi:hypothetical protein
MNDPITREFCDERHKHTETLLNKIDKSIDTLFARLNWFFILTITTLASALTSILIGLHKHTP